MKAKAKDTGEIIDVKFTTSGKNEPYYNSFIKVNPHNLEEYLKTL